MVQTRFAVAGMTCENCRAKVTAALVPLAAGGSVTVTRNPDEAVFASPGSVALDAVRGALVPLGLPGRYTAEPLPVGAGTSSGSAAPTPRPQPAAASSADAPVSWLAWLTTYQPLLLIAGYIAVASFAGGGHANAGLWMTHFMAGFFLVLSFFKFLDLPGFASAYGTYDLLAARIPAYGFVYPFLELGLGLAYLFQIAPTWTNAATLVLMAFSSLGVVAALSNGKRIRCACLGTVLNLPMTSVTLVEDLSMAAMAGLMLAHG
jgi:copper chaperone CopZ